MIPVLIHCPVVASVGRRDRRVPRVGPRGSGQPRPRYTATTTIARRPPSDCHLSGASMAATAGERCIFYYFIVRPHIQRETVVEYLTPSSSELPRSEGVVRFVLGDVAANNKPLIWRRGMRPVQRFRYEGFLSLRGPTGAGGHFLQYLTVVLYTLRPVSSCDLALTPEQISLYGAFLSTGGAGLFRPRVPGEDSGDGDNDFWEALLDDS